MEIWIFWKKKNLENWIGSCIKTYNESGNIIVFWRILLGKKCRYWEYLGVLEKMIILEVWNGVGRGEDGVEGGGGGYEGHKTQRFRA